jgi:hypothetical protein
MLAACGEAHFKIEVLFYRCTLPSIRPYRGFERKGDRVHILKYFSRHYQIAVKIKPLYLTNNTRYLTSNTTRVVQQ